MLGWLARNGRLVLVAGLVIGIAVPALARAMQPMIVPLIAMMLFLATLRIGTVAARPRPRDVPLHLGTAVLFQTVMPLAALAVLTLFGWQDSIVGLGVCWRSPPARSPAVRGLRSCRGPIRCRPCGRWSWARRCCP